MTTRVRRAECNHRHAFETDRFTSLVDGCFAAAAALRPDNDLIECRVGARRRMRA